MAEMENVLKQLSACSISSSIDIIKKMAEKRKVVDEQRVLFLKFGVESEVKGSAYMEYGNTKVRATIDGPNRMKDVTKSAPNGILTCSVHYATFVSTYLNEKELKEKELSSQVTQALKAVILRKDFENFEFIIEVNILNDDGCALSTAINCAGAAIVHSGLPMYDFVTSSTIALYKDVYYINPDAKMEHKLRNAKYDVQFLEHGFMILSNMDEIDEITQLYQCGALLEDTFINLLDMVVENNKRVKVALFAQIDREMKAKVGEDKQQQQQLCDNDKENEEPNDKVALFEQIDREMKANAVEDQQQQLCDNDEGNDAPNDNVEVAKKN